MKTWTDNEVALLKENYNRLTNNQLIELFPNKSFTAIYKKARKLGLYKTKEIEYCNRSLARKGDKCSNWKGGVSVTPKGYRLIYKPDHHRADSKGYVLEHILVFEKETGIIVPNNCCIHHINGNKQDNKISNLCMMLKSAHTIYHHLGSKRNDETKAKLSNKAKERLKDKKKHPCYKEINIKAMIDEVNSGQTVKDVCKKYGICTSTYYSHIKEVSNE